MQKIHQIDNQTLQEIINSSYTFAEILQKLGYDGYNGNHRTLKRRIKKDNLDLSEFNKNHKDWEINQRGQCLIKLNSKYSFEEVFSKDSPVKNAQIKRLLIRNKLIKYECEKCLNSGEWMGEKLSLQLDHKNGINSDNRIENLRFLCANCHSQTDTFSGKNIPKIKYFCETCNTETKGYGKVCVECQSKSKRKFEISKEELEILVFSYPMRELAKRFKVSDVAIKKRCKLLNIKTPPVGFWLRSK